MSFHARRFGRASGSYAGYSHVQREMAGALLDLLAGQTVPRAPASAGPILRVLEMGCGTANLTLHLRAFLQGTAGRSGSGTRAELLATDAAPSMLDEARKALDAAGPADGIATSLAAFDASGTGSLPEAVESRAPFALAASNALVQWFPDLASHFRMVAGLTAPGGAYLVSGFSRGNFPELNALLRERPFGYRDFPGHAREEVEASLRGAFALEQWREDSLEEAYPDPQAFLAAIRGLGSSRRPPEKGPLTRTGLALLRSRYQERYAIPGGVRVTWKPWYALLRKTA